MSPSASDDIALSSSLSSSDGKFIESPTLPTPSAPFTASQSAFAKHFRLVNDELASCGIGAYINAPTIAIIGSQSAGKSSVLEALSQISFPRAAGTCTRTPTQVRMYNAPNEAWSCKISLRLEVDSRGHPVKLVETLPFGEALTDAKDVQDYISAAQFAILNPKKIDAPPSELVKTIRSRREVDNEIDFSANTICLDVRGPEVVDLSLIDLPGLIGTAGEGKDSNLVSMIRELAKKTIAQDNCLILLTIPMSEDYNNQSAVQLAKEVDPDGERTLGVLTKPDRIEGGNFRLWKPIIEGMTERLTHGYHVVRNPTSNEMKTAKDYAKARAIETAFFKTQPWCSMMPPASERLGSISLGARLEVLLGKLIEEKLPATIAKVHELSRKTDAKLRALPEAIAENRAKVELHNLCLSLCETLKDVLAGDKDASMFALPQKILFHKFRAKIFASRPIIFPLTEAEKARKPFVAADVNSGKDLCKHSEFDAVESVVDLSTANQKQVAEVLKSSLLVGHHESALKITLTTIQQEIGGCATELLPGNVPWRVKENLMSRAVEPMFKLAEDLFADVLRNLVAVVKYFAGARFDAFQGSPVGRMVTEILLKHVDECKATCVQLLNGIVKTEKETIASLNHHYFTDKKEAIVKELTAVRAQWCLDAPERLAQFAFGRPVDTASAASQAEMPQGHKAPAHILEHIEVCAEVRAYWQVVYKRFVDYVRGFIVVHLVNAFSKTCLQELCGGIGLHGDLTPARAMELLRDSDATHRQRTTLLLQRARLDKALEVIQAFQRESL